MKKDGERKSQPENRPSKEKPSRKQEHLTAQEKEGGEKSSNMKLSRERRISAKRRPFRASARK